MSTEETPSSTASNSAASPRVEGETETQLQTPSRSGPFRREKRVKNVGESGGRVKAHVVGMEHQSAHGDASQGCIADLHTAGPSKPSAVASSSVCSAEAERQRQQHVGRQPVHSNNPRPSIPTLGSAHCGAGTQDRKSRIICSDDGDSASSGQTDSSSVRNVDCSDYPVASFTRGFSQNAGTRREVAGNQIRSHHPQHSARLQTKSTSHLSTVCVSSQDSARVVFSHGFTGSSYDSAGRNQEQSRGARHFLHDGERFDQACAPLFPNHKDDIPSSVSLPSLEKRRRKQRSKLCANPCAAKMFSMFLKVAAREKNKPAHKPVSPKKPESVDTKPDKILIQMPSAVGKHDLSVNTDGKIECENDGEKNSSGEMAEVKVTAKHAAGHFTSDMLSSDSLCVEPTSGQNEPTAAVHVRKAASKKAADRCSPRTHLREKSDRDPKKTAHKISSSQSQSCDSQSHDTEHVTSNHDTKQQSVAPETAVRNTGYTSSTNRLPMQNKSRNVNVNSQPAKPPLRNHRGLTYDEICASTQSVRTPLQSQTESDWSDCDQPRRKDSQLKNSKENLNRQINAAKNEYHMAGPNSEQTKVLVSGVVPLKDVVSGQSESSVCTPPPTMEASSVHTSAFTIYTSGPKTGTSVTGSSAGVVMNLVANERSLHGTSRCVSSVTGTDSAMVSQLTSMKSDSVNATVMLSCSASSGMQESLRPQPSHPTAETVRARVGSGSAVDQPSQSSEDAVQIHPLDCNLDEVPIKMVNELTFDFQKCRLTGSNPAAKLRYITPADLRKQALLKPSQPLRYLTSADARKAQASKLTSSAITFKAKHSDYLPVLDQADSMVQTAARPEDVDHASAHKSCGSSISSMSDVSLVGAVQALTQPVRSPEQNKSKITTTKQSKSDAAVMQSRVVRNDEPHSKHGWESHVARLYKSVGYTLQRLVVSDGDDSSVMGQADADVSGVPPAECGQQSSPQLQLNSKRVAANGIAATPKPVDQTRHAGSKDGLHSAIVSCPLSKANMTAVETHAQVSNGQFGKCSGSSPPIASTGQKVKLKDTVEVSEVVNSENSSNVNHSRSSGQDKPAADIMETNDPCSFSTDALTGGVLEESESVSDVDAEYLAEDMDLFGDVIVPAGNTGNVRHGATAQSDAGPTSQHQVSYVANTACHASMNRAWHYINQYNHPRTLPPYYQPLVSHQNMHGFVNSSARGRSAQSTNLDHSTSSVSDYNGDDDESDVEADDEDEEGGGADYSADVGYIRIHSQDDDGDGALFAYYSPESDSSGYEDDEFFSNPYSRRLDEGPGWNDRHRYHKYRRHPYSHPAAPHRDYHPQGCPGWPRMSFRPSYRHGWCMRGGAYQAGNFRPIYQRDCSRDMSREYDCYQLGRISQELGKDPHDLYGDDRMSHMNKKDPKDTHEMRCYHCKAVSHMARDCLLEKVTCHNCKQVGHMAKECPAKFKKDADSARSGEQWPPWPPSPMVRMRWQSPWQHLPGPPHLRDPSSLFRPAPRGSMPCTPPPLTCVRRNRASPSPSPPPLPSSIGPFTGLPPSFFMRPPPPPPLSSRAFRSHNCDSGQHLPSKSPRRNGFREQHEWNAPDDSYFQWNYGEYYPPPELSYQDSTVDGKMGTGGSRCMAGGVEGMGRANEPHHSLQSPVDSLPPPPAVKLQIQGVSSPPATPEVSSQCLPPAMRYQTPEVSSQVLPPAMRPQTPEVLPRCPPRRSLSDSNISVPTKWKPATVEAMLVWSRDVCAASPPQSPAQTPEKTSDEALAASSVFQKSPSKEASLVSHVEKPAENDHAQLQDVESKSSAYERAAVLSPAEQRIHAQKVRTSLLKSYSRSGSTNAGSMGEQVITDVGPEHPSTGSSKPVESAQLPGESHQSHSHKPKKKKSRGRSDSANVITQAMQVSGGLSALAKGYDSDDEYAGLSSKLLDDSLADDSLLDRMDAMVTVDQDTPHKDLRTKIVEDCEISSQDSTELPHYTTWSKWDAVKMKQKKRANLPLTEGSEISEQHEVKMNELNNMAWTIRKVDLDAAHIVDVGNITHLSSSPQPEQSTGTSAVSPSYVDHSIELDVACPPHKTCSKSKYQTCHKDTSRVNVRCGVDQPAMASESAASLEAGTGSDPRKLHKAQPITPCKVKLDGDGTLLHVNYDKVHVCMTPGKSAMTPATVADLQPMEAQPANDMMQVDNLEERRIADTDVSSSMVLTPNWKPLHSSSEYPLSVPCGTQLEYQFGPGYEIPPRMLKGMHAQQISPPEKQLKNGTPKSRWTTIQHNSSSKQKTTEGPIPGDQPARIAGKSKHKVAPSPLSVGDTLRWLQCKSSASDCSSQLGNKSTATQILESGIADRPNSDSKDASDEKEVVDWFNGVPDNWDMKKKVSRRNTHWGPAKEVEAQPVMPFKPDLIWSLQNQMKQSPGAATYMSPKTIAPRWAFLSSPKTDWKEDFRLRYSQVRIPYIDTHCHIDFLLTRTRYTGSYADYMKENAQTVPRCFEGCISIYCNPRHFNKEDGLWLEVLKESDVWGAAGCHPKCASDYDSAAEENLVKMLAHPKMIALGEIGLDYSKQFSEQATKQKQVFVRQINIAIQMKLPVVIHCRDAEEDCRTILTEILPREHKMHRHCFTETWPEAQQWLAQFPNSFIGLTPLVTQHGRRARGCREVARHIPLNRLLLETDAPYFVPEGIPNDEMNMSHPGMAITVAAEVASIRGIDIHEVLQACRENTKKMYGV